MDFIANKCNVDVLWEEETIQRSNRSTTTPPQAESLERLLCRGLSCRSCIPRIHACDTLAECTEHWVLRRKTPQKQHHGVRGQRKDTCMISLPITTFGKQRFLQQQYCRTIYNNVRQRSERRHRGCVHKQTIRKTKDRRYYIYTYI